MTAAATLDDTANAATGAARGDLHPLATLRSPEGRPFVRGLVAITLVAAAVRVMNVLWWRPTTSHPGFQGFTLTGDSFYYHWQANALAEDTGTSTRSAGRTRV